MENRDLERLPLIRSKLSKALAKLNAFLNEEHSEMQMVASIKSFEFTFELSLRLIDLILKLNGHMTNGSRDSVRISGKIGLIESVEDWLSYIDERNLTVHTYDEDVVTEIYSTLNKFAKSVENLFDQSAKFLN